MSIVSRETQIRIKERNKAEDSCRNYGYAYELKEATGLRVTDWGRPSKIDFIDCRDGFVRKADIWAVLWVIVYVGKFASRQICDGRGIHSGWNVWLRYPTQSFQDVRKVFELHLGTCGLYHRACYCIEEWEWTEQNGWEPADHV